jgi:uncharacterized DUF497 family protein
MPIRIPLRSFRHYGTPQCEIISGLWYNCYTIANAVPFRFAEKRTTSGKPEARSRLEEVQEVFSHPYYQDQRSDVPEQYRAIGWVSERLYTVIFEVREDQAGEYYHLVTLWKATKEEQQLYDERS